MILCKWSFEFSIQLCHWHSHTIQSLSQKVLQTMKCTHRWRDQTCCAISHWQKLGTPLLTQTPQCDSSSGGVNTMSHPVRTTVSNFPSTSELQIYLDIQKIHSLSAQTVALAVDAWQPLRGPAQTSQGVTCIYCQVCSTESTKVWKHQNVSLKITQHNLSTETIWRSESRGLRTPPWVPRLLQGLTPTWEGHCAASEGTAPQENVWSESHYSELLPRLAFNKLSGWLKNSTGSNCKAEFWFACSAFPAVILSGIGQLNLALLVAGK